MSFPERHPKQHPQWFLSIDHMCPRCAFLGIGSFHSAFPVRRLLLPLVAAVDEFSPGSLMLFADKIPFSS